MSDKNDGSFLGGLLAGGLLGAAVALLLTPFKGEEARAKLKKKATVLKKEWDKSLEEASQTSVGFQKEALDLVKDLGDSLQEKSQELPRQAKKIIDDVKTVVEDRVAQAQKPLKQPKKPRYFKGISR